MKTKITDAEYDDILAYSLRKLQCIGQGDDYLPLLLADEIQHFVAAREINQLSAIMREVEQCAIYA